MSRSDARSFLGPPDEDGPEPPVHAQPRAVRALSAVLRLFMSNMRLRSDARREGQDTFTASPFTRLALTQMLSLGGDAMVTVALAGSLFFSTPNVAAARGRVALSLVLTVAPFAIVAPLLGPMVDRVKGGRRAMIVASAVGRIAACLFMARYINGLLLFPAALLALVCSKTYTVAKAAIVPAVVEHNDDLVEANSKLAIVGAIAGFLASVPGIPILKLFGAAALLRVDSVVFLLCAISAFRLVPAPAARVVRAADADTGPASRFKARANLPPGGLTAAAVAMATLRFTVGFMVFLVAFAFRRTGAPAWWYGVILAASVGGNLIGAAIAPRLRGRVREEYILAGSLCAVVVAGILLIPFDLLQRRPAASLLAAVVGIAAGAAKLAFDSLVQQEVPEAAQGRMFGRLEATFQLVWVFGALAPVVIALSLAEGDVVVTVLAGAALVTYLLGVSLARRGRLPQWWPGSSHPPAGAPAIAGGVGVPPVGGRGPAPFWPDPPAPGGADGGVAGGPVVEGPGFGGPALGGPAGGGPALGGPAGGGPGAGGPGGAGPGGAGPGAGGPALGGPAGGGPGVGAPGVGAPAGSGGTVFSNLPAEGPLVPQGLADTPTVASGPPTTPNLARPPRLRPPPLNDGPPPLGGPPVPEDPA